MAPTAPHSEERGCPKASGANIPTLGQKPAWKPTVGVFLSRCLGRWWADFCEFLVLL